MLEHNTKYLGKTKTSYPEVWTFEPCSTFKQFSSALNTQVLLDNTLASNKYNIYILHSIN